MFVGRTKEYELLDALWTKRTASLVVCRGRRRIGKSRLIQEFGSKADQFLEFQGLPPRPGIDRGDQLSAFGEQLAAQTSLPRLGIENWLQAFQLLNSAIGRRKAVILLDEVSWMAQGDADFAGSLKIAWDTLFKNHKRLIVVVCGSVSSWMERNILCSAAFVGRVSLDLVLRELPLTDCMKFWGAKGSRISEVEKFRFLGVTGGVPKYLEELRPERSVEHNIHRLCFSQHGIMVSEFDRIFDDVFGRRSQVYRRIVETLTDGPRERVQIIEAAGLEPGGTVSGYLNDLQMSGMISEDYVYRPGVQQPGRKYRFRLSDNYLRFYLKYIAPNRHRIEQGLFDDATVSDIVAWDTLMGLQFENLVLNNLPLLFESIGLSPGDIVSASPYFQTSTRRQQGCQIDLLIQTRRTLYVCEIKFQEQVRADVIGQVLQKIDRLKIPKGYTVRPVLIYVGRLSSSLVRNDGFDALVDFAELLSR